MTKDGKCDSYLRKVREVGAAALQNAVSRVEGGMSMQEASLRMGAGNAYLTYMAWLVAPEAAKEERARKGRQRYHLEVLVLTPEEEVAFERLARCHPRIKGFYAEPKAKPVEETQLDRIEAKLDRLLDQLG